MQHSSVGRRIILAACLLLVGAVPAACEGPSPIFTFPVNAAPQPLVLKIYPVLFEGHGVQFLYHRTTGRNTLLAIATVDHSLWYSNDLARTWTVIPNTARRGWSVGFVTEDGNFLVWDGHAVHLLDAEGPPGGAARRAGNLARQRGDRAGR